ncbi:hypothetical protein RCH10_003798 [Variovorax sp. GrIS 2.14]|uniref:hypothetical protein n=1 Tax=Variovorax sp. GrIS 2.14 TaxID=3071709 RepID=UPI0038F6F6DF
MSALPLTLDQDIVDRLNRILHKTGHIGQDALPRFERAALFRDLDRLARTNVVQADCLRATIATLEADDAVVEDRIRNLEMNGAPDMARSERVRFAANRLRASEFLPLVREAVHHPLPHALHEVLPSMVTIGAFHAARDALAEADRQQRVAHATPVFAIAREGARVLDELGVDDDAMARTIDVVGQVLWKHRLIWLTDHADVWTSPAGSPPNLLLQYRVQLSPRAAADLSWEISSELAGVDLPPRGVSIGLLGTELELAAVA